MTRLRVGCVGTGFIAGRHLAALGGFADVQVVAVADADAGRAQATAARWGARPYEDGLALVAEEDLDAVWLCVPPFAHGALESAALDRGLPFFVEKPLAVELAGAAEVAARVADAGLLTAVGYHWRHLDVVEQAAALLRGRPAHLVTASWLDRTPPAPWWSQRARSGGQVLEQTTHLLDLLRLLVGEVETVTAAEVVRERPQHPGADVPVASSAVLTFRSGAVGTVSSTCGLGWRHEVGVRLLAEGLAVEVVERALSDHELRTTSADGATATTSDQDPVAREDREFLDVLRGDAAAVRVPYAEALRTQALAWAVDRSAREGVPVRVAQELAGA